MSVEKSYWQDVMAGKRFMVKLLNEHKATLQTRVNAALGGGEYDIARAELAKLTDVDVILNLFITRLETLENEGDE